MSNNMNKKIFNIFVFCLPFLVGCSNDIETTALGNDCIKRSISPNIVGEKIEFTYAMALPSEIGLLSSVEVFTSIPGAEGTYFDPKSYSTNSGGVDVGVKVAADSRLEGNKCLTEFVVDTCASTLRFYYVIPEEARNKEVSLAFSVKSTNGEQQKYEMGPYKISKMDMLKGLELTADNSCYFSIEDMKIYSKAEILADSKLAEKIDLIYGYDNNKTIGHAFYAPTASSEYLAETIVPAGAKSDTKMLKSWGIRDQQLSDLQWAVFVDDLDFTELSYEHASNCFLSLKAENGIWLESADKKYRAYIFINAVENGKMTMSLKRYSF
jgi:hypothetical protein